MRYIEVANWDSFQQYKDGRTPTWIKLHVNLTQPYDRQGKKKFYTMSDAAKLTFVLILCGQAHFDHGIPYEGDTQLGFLLGIDKVEVQPLIDNGYITIRTESVEVRTGSYEPIQKSTQEQDQYTIDKEKEKEQDKEQNPETELVVEENTPDFLKLGLKLAEMLTAAFKPFNEKEVVTFERIRVHLVKWALQEMTHRGDTMERIEGCIKAAKAPGVKKPKAMFVSKVKKLTGFTGNGVIL